MKPILKYYPEDDIFTIRVKRGQIADEKLLDNDIVLSYNKKNELIRLEIWQASTKGLIPALIDVAKRNPTLLDALIERHNGKQQDTPEIEAK
jgi:uncharacterized protein YuzE